ncbi:AAA family ATPase [Tardiphaga alba]|nr:AAA family ATPase [Tardiphaga alba]
MNSEFLDYAEKNGLALLRVDAGAKGPTYPGWQNATSTARSDWEAWLAGGYNIGVHSGHSRLIVVDLDVKGEGGRDGVWSRWQQLCADNGDDASNYPVHVSSGSKGLHIYFRANAGIDITKAIPVADVELRAGKHQTLAPGSVVNGNPYQMYPDPQAPYTAPAWMIGLCQKEQPRTEPREASAELRNYDIDRVGRWIDRKLAGEWADDPTALSNLDWAMLGKALKLHFPNDAGLALWLRMSNDPDGAARRWHHDKAEYKDGDRTLTWYFDRDADWMFGDVIDMLNGSYIPSPSLAPEMLPAGVPLPGAYEVDHDEGARALSVFSAASFEGLPVPTRKWHVRDLIPGDTVTLLYGDGGTGKSLIALQLLASTAIGCAWLGRGVQRGPCLFVTAEDSRDEVHMRLVDVARAYSVPLSAMPDLHIVSLAGEDAIIAAPEGRSSILTPTALFAAIEAHVAAQRPRLVVLDTLADLFGGNEIDRSQARQFIGLLRGLALTYQTAILLLAHPSVSGMAKGTGASGSTGWNNSVRSRLYFDRIRAEDNSEPDPDARVLRSMKSNYGPVGAEIVVHWQRGVFVAERVTADGLAAAQDARKRADDIFVKLLMLYEAEGRGAVSPNPGSNYAPKLFADHEASQGMKARALKDAMDRLLASRRIETIMEGPPSRMRQRLIVSQKLSVESQATNALPTAFQGGTNAPTNGLPTHPETLPTAFQRPAIPTPYTPVSLARP